MSKRISSYLFVLLGLMLVLGSCKKEYESAQSIDDAKIEEYLRKNNVSAIRDPDGTGFYYQVTNPAEGEFYKDTDSILYVISIKSLLNGTTYYTSPENTNLGTYVGYARQVGDLNIEGLLTVLHQLKPGGVARMILPSYLAYGKNGYDALKVPSNEIIDLTVTTFADESQAVLDDRRLRAFIAAKGLTATKDEKTGVYYVITSGGTGTEPIDMATTLTLNYTGRLFDGTVFESTTDGSFETELTGVIKGWEVLTKLKKGAKVRLLVPSVQAYGTTGTTSNSTGVAVQPNSNLDFDIEIADAVN